MKRGDFMAGKDGIISAVKEVAEKSFATAVIGALVKKGVDRKKAEQAAKEAAKAMDEDNRVWHSITSAYD